MESSLTIVKKRLLYAVSIIAVFSLLINYTQYSNAANKTAPKPTILILGDSLSAAYGINTEQGWTFLLQAKLKTAGFKYQVVNASVSGDTTRTGLNRLKPLLTKYHPKILIVALGGNDGLRGLTFTEISNSLEKIILLAQKLNSQVLLAAVRLPPNYSVAYNARFAAVFKKTANKFKIPLVPRLLDNVGNRTELMQADRIHPKASAQNSIVKNVWPELKLLLE